MDGVIHPKTKTNRIREDKHIRSNSLQDQDSADYQPAKSKESSRRPEKHAAMSITLRGLIKPVALVLLGIAVVGLAAFAVNFFITNTGPQTNNQNGIETATNQPPAVQATTGTEEPSNIASPPVQQNDGDTATQETKPLEASNPVIVTCDTRALLKWTTSIPASGKVHVGLTGNEDLYKADTDISTSHEVQVNSLSPETTYFYEITSSGGSSEVSSQGSFKTRPEATKFVVENNPAPSFILEQAGGGLYGLEPQNTLLNFWSTSCKPCRRELPLIQELHELYQNDSNVSIITVCISESSTGISEFLNNKDNCYIFGENAETNLLNDDFSPLISGYGMSASQDIHPLIENLGANHVSGNSATLQCEVTKSDDAYYKITLFLGPEIGGANPADWEEHLYLTPGDYRYVRYGLAANKTYYCRFALEDSTGSLLWSPTIESFTVGQPVTTQISNASGATHVTSTSAVLSGDLNWYSIEDKEVYVCWGEKNGGADFDQWEHKSLVPASSNGPLTFEATNLHSGKDYYYRYYVKAYSGFTWAPNTKHFKAVDPERLLQINGSSAGSRTLQANRLYYSRFVAASSGYLDDIQLECTAEGNVKLALYSHNGAGPASLLFSNPDSIHVAKGTTRISLPKVALSKDETYWIAMIADTACVLGTESDTTTQYKDVSYKKYSFPVLLDTSGKIAKSYGISMIPATYFIDSEGIIKKIFVGQLTSKEQVTDILNSY